MAEHELLYAHRRAVEIRKEGGKEKVKKAKGWRLEVKGRDNEMGGNSMEIEKLIRKIFGNYSLIRVLGRSMKEDRLFYSMRMKILSIRE